jgi:prephenate dehydrogenase
MGECDFILVALYPGAVIEFVRSKAKCFSSHSVVIDCSGVKGRVCSELFETAAQNSFTFYGGHPMAGIESSGYESSFAELFLNASMILCSDPAKDPEPESILDEFFLALAFDRVVKATAKEHDEIIAYTSQLAHIVSSAFIKNPFSAESLGFSAGSYRDLTRVAKLNEKMWSELFMENRENLIVQIDILVSSILDYRDALAKQDYNVLSNLLKEGTRLKMLDEKRTIKQEGLSCKERLVLRPKPDITM